MDLQLLRGFVTVAGELHFGRAALRLHISQPALSRRILRLEREVGAKLLRRTKRRVELTEEGKLFLDGARRTLAEVEQAIRRTQLAGRGEIGRLAIGFVGATIVPPFLREYRRRFPGVELELQQLTTTRQIEALKERTVQVGFVRPPITSEDLAMETVVREPIVLVMWKSHPLATQRGRLRLRALAREPFVFSARREGPGYYDTIVSLCRRSGFTPRVVQEANEMQTLLNLVAGGLGVSLVPRSVARLRASDLVYRHLKEVGAEVELALAWRADEESPLVTSFVTLVREMRRAVGRSVARRRRNEGS